MLPALKSMVMPPTMKQKTMEAISTPTNMLALHCRCLLHTFYSSNMTCSNRLPISV